MGPSQPWSPNPFTLPLTMESQWAGQLEDPEWARILNGLPVQNPSLKKAFCVQVRFRAPQKSVCVDSYVACEIQIANGCLSFWSFLHVVPTKLLAGQQKLHFKNLLSLKKKKPMREIDLNSSSLCLSTSFWKWRRISKYDHQITSPAFSWKLNQGRRKINGQHNANPWRSHHYLISFTSTSLIIHGAHLFIIICILCKWTVWVFFFFFFFFIFVLLEGHSKSHLYDGRAN